MGDLLHTYKNNFKIMIKKIRKDAGYTQKTLADALGISIETIKNWEQGRNIPEIEIICRLCDFFDCDIDYLFNNIECKKHDDEFIHQETGLSEIAIRNIRYINDFHEYNYKIDILNALLENDDFSLRLMTELSNYNFSQKLYYRQLQLETEYKNAKEEICKNNPDSPFPHIIAHDILQKDPKYKEYNRTNTRLLKDRKDISLVRLERIFSDIIKSVMDNQSIPHEQYISLYSKKEGD